MAVKNSPSSVDASKPLTLEELAAREGVSIQTVYHWNKTRTGPRYYRAGRHCRYRLADVIAWENSRYADLDGAA
ncbi:AlpA family transcriptional regulator [Planomonospora sp. ID82291]|uniref:helix-turn-helix transcriptional regulator n=1 Tax=Planomonospora sp. ID82291 TaxID=2738136 RepID=UPI0018C44182|nr:helix-turn-helix domain-containing protein [Planomonospora sp. ID82291]MBG0818203.1 helix-turn-helix domain-containing protein [Planomonospora sp. ID82291]